MRVERWSRRELLSLGCLATVAVVGCTGGDDGSAAGSDDDSSEDGSDSDGSSGDDSNGDDGPEVLADDQVRVTFEPGTMTVDELGDAALVSLRRVGRRPTHETVEAVGASVSLDPGHFEVYYEEDPDAIIEETVLGTIRVGEVFFELTDWDEVDAETTNADGSDGTLRRDDPDEELAYEFDVDGRYGLGEAVIRIVEEETEAETHVWMGQRGGEQVSSTLAPNRAERHLGYPHEGDEDVTVEISAEAGDGPIAVSSLELLGGETVTVLE